MNETKWAVLELGYKKSGAVERNRTRGKASM